MNEHSIKIGDYVMVIDVHKTSSFYDIKHIFNGRIFKLKEKGRRLSGEYYIVYLQPITDKEMFNFGIDDEFCILGAKLEKLDDEYVMSKII